jgi:hypothetical protein
MYVGLVFPMIDCLSDDEDEEPHPVSLPDFVVYCCTWGAERKRYGSITEKVHFRTGNYPLPWSTPGDTREIKPVFPDSSSNGLIGR